MKLKLLAATIALSAWTASANAIPVNVSEANGEKSLQTILNDLTVGVGVNSSIDVNADQAAPDEIWNSTNSSMSPVRFIAEIAGFAGDNSFGIYDINDTSTALTLFSGADTAGAKTIFEIMPDGTIEVWGGDSGVTLSSKNFGFFLSTPDNTFYSEMKHNPGGEDQMVAYNGKGDTIKIPGANVSVWDSGGWIVAFEDQVYSNSDQDFNDMVVFIESAMPVPEPGTLALLGLGLAGLGAARRRQKA